jgi:hypothetical protein
MADAHECRRQAAECTRLAETDVAPQIRGDHAGHGEELECSRKPDGPPGRARAPLVSPAPRCLPRTHGFGRTRQMKCSSSAAQGRCRSGHTSSLDFADVVTFRCRGNLLAAEIA